MLRELARTFRLAIPVMFSRAGILIMVAVDTAMSGHAGADQIGFYSIGAAILIPLVVISVGLLTATVVMTAQADGAGRHNEGGTIVVIGFGYALLLGTVALLLTRLAEPILSLFGQDATTVDGAAPVLKMLGLGMPALVCFATASFFLEALHKPIVGTLAMLAGNIVNVMLNWVLVFGNSGFPAMGAEGAAAATTVTRYLMAIGMLLYLWFCLDRERHGIGRLYGNLAMLVRRFAWIGWPMALGAGLESSAFALLMLMAGNMGQVKVGAYAIAHNVNGIAFMFALGLSTAAGIRTGNAWGRSDPSGVSRAGWTAIVCGVSVLAGVALLCLVFSESIVRIYTDDAQIFVLAVSIVPFMAVALIPDGCQVVVIGALRGANDFWSGALSQFAGFWLVMLPVAWYFGVVNGGGVATLLVAVFAGAMVTLMLTTIRFYRITRPQNFKARKSGASR